MPGTSRTMWARSGIRISHVGLAAATTVAMTPAVPARADGTLRPPAVPLVTHDPYFSIWSPADHLYDAWPVHWTGKRNGMECMVRVDGSPFRLMGPEPKSVPPLPQQSLQVWPTRTVYTFSNKEVQVTLTFCSPLLPHNLDVLGSPLTYLTWSIQSNDGREHDVQLYFDCTGELAVNTPDQAVQWAHTDTAGLAVLEIGSVDQPVLLKKGDDLRIDWGHAYAAAPMTADVRHVVTPAEQARDDFAAGRDIPKADEARRPRAVNDGWPAMVFTFDLGKVGKQPVTRWSMLAYDDEYSIRYFGARLRPYWRRGGGDMAALLKVAARERSKLLAGCERFDQELTEDLKSAGGEKYARMATLAYRQALAACKLAADANGRPLLFPKENFSNGCVNTVDVIYPMAPLFLMLGPDLAKAMLVPVLDYGSSERWTFPFAPHDLGTYPHATGQVYGGGETGVENQMPVEESADMILLVAALAHAEENADFAGKYWPTLVKWAEYLKAKGLDPENQLCTDDFTGHLAHNVNLSCKAILALGAFSRLSEMHGDKASAKEYREIAEHYAGQWATMAADGDHTRLAFDKPGTWSQKYNMVWDNILGLGLFPADLKKREVEHYKKVQQTYGLPLDSRADFTKIDWTHWSAMLTGDKADFETLVAPLHEFLNRSPDRVPMCDWFKTTEPRIINMIARPVVGGLFMPALGNPTIWKKWFVRGAAGRGDWAPLPLAKVTAVTPTARDTGVEWRYTTEEPADGWSRADFDDTAWKLAPSGFGTKGTPGSVVRTEWESADIWLRAELDVATGDNKALQLAVHHDEDAEIYLNGVLAARLTGYTTGYETTEITREALAAVKPGKNTIAVHCHQTSGGQYIDVGLVRVEMPSRQ